MLLAKGGKVIQAYSEMASYVDMHGVIKGKFADVNNLNSAAHGNGCTSGGAFLSFFTKGVKWAHIDIAGAAWGARAKDYYTGGATGTAVRTLLQWVRGL